jgi:hypothetical protein
LSTSGATTIHGRVGDHQNVLARRRRLHLLGREPAAGAGLVLDDDGDAQPGLQLLADDAGDAVGRLPSRREAGHDAQRVGVCARSPQAVNAKQGGGGSSLHGQSPGRSFAARVHSSCRTIDCSNQSLPA